MEDMTMLTDRELDEVSGGGGGVMDSGYRTVYNLKKGYLALRSKPYYDENNVIGELYNGDKVRIVEYKAINSTDGHQYIKVSSPTHRKTGYVNISFLRK